ncbi:MAG: hypothetical protein IJ812_04890 [Schwartzia sp.]|nr:hypothetical protein [Schwartzia sp. (in: firmicutes)]
MTIEEYTAICLRFAEDTKNDGAPDDGRLFVTWRGGWTSSCDNAHGGLGVGWAFGKSADEIRRLAPQKHQEFTDMINAHPVR